MFRMTKSKTFFVHKCIQCGLVTAYGTYTVSTCEHCNTTQRICADKGKSSAPIKFLMDVTEYWRMAYHMKETNMP